jgi:hypothetical protein
MSVNPISATYRRDGNYVPITTDGITISDTQSLTTTGTVVVPLFTVTGTVEVRGLWAVVTNASLGNCTAAYFRLNDSSNQSDITLNTGTALTNAPVGSLILKRLAATNAVTLLTSAQERVQEPGATNCSSFEYFIASAKATATTNIEFVYTTSDNPTTGTIQFFLRWLPMSADGNITAL